MPAPSPIATPVGATGAPATTEAISFGSLPAAGTAVIVSINLSESGTTQTTVTGVADNQSGNTFVKIKSAWSGFGGSVELWWCPSITTPSGTYTVTVTLATVAQCNGWLLDMMAVPGLAGTVDQSNTGIASSGASLTVTNGSPNTNANDFVVATMVMGNFNPTPALSDPSSGYTSWFLDQSVINNQTGMGAGYKTVSALETSSAAWTWTGSSNNSGIVATFQTSASGGTSIAWTV